MFGQSYQKTSVLQLFDKASGSVNESSADSSVTSLIRQMDVTKDPFSVGYLRCPQALLIASECEEKSGYNSTPCCTHPITSLGKDTHHIGVFKRLIHQLVR